MEKMKEKKGRRKKRIYEECEKEGEGRNKEEINE